MGAAAAGSCLEEISIRQIHGKFTGKIFKCQMGLLGGYQYPSDSWKVEWQHSELAHGRIPVSVILVGHMSTNYRAGGGVQWENISIWQRSSQMGKGFQVSDCTGEYIYVAVIRLLGN